MPDEILVEAATGAAIETAVVGALLDKEVPPGGEQPVFGTVCSNCHTKLKGRHCHHCGQVADTFHRPVWALFGEILEGYLGLDGRISRTVPALVFQPGKVTVQYLNGVRQPYMTPFRLFLLSSLLFFLVFAVFTSNTSILNSKAITDIAEQEGVAIDASRTALEQASAELTGIKQSAGEAATPTPGLELAQAGIDAIDRELKRAQAAKALGPSRFSIKQRALCELRSEALPEYPASALCAQAFEEKKQRALAANLDDEGAVIEIPIETGNTGLNSSASVDTEKLQKMFPLETRRFLVENIETAVNDPDQYRASLGRWAPRLVFILAPAYGLILALSFFWRRDIFIYDHMVVALHFHAFLFLFVVLLIPLGLVIGAGLAGLLFALWSNYYLYRLMRRVYQAGRFGAIARVFLLDTVYFILLLFAFLSLLFLGIVFV